MPTPDQIRSFGITLDGQERPDLVPLALKVRDAINAYESQERLKAILTQRDQELTDAFRSAEAIAAQEDTQITDAMYKNLCERIDDMDGESAAGAIAEMDKVILERWQARTETYLESLTPESVKAVLSEAEELGRTIKGTTNNLVALASQHPDFVKHRIKEICAARGFTRKANR
jgi:hypothetical protein